MCHSREEPFSASWFAEACLWREAGSVTWRACILPGSASFVLEERCATCLGTSWWPMDFSNSSHRAGKAQALMFEWNSMAGSDLLSTGRGTSASLRFAGAC